MVDFARQVLDLKLADLGQRFEIRGWVGPCLSAPDETVAEYAYQGRPDLALPLWEVFMYRAGDQDSRNPTGRKGVVRAAIRYDDAQIENVTVEELAYRLTAAVAGREAHEALEWASLDGHLPIDPHDGQQLAAAADLIADYVKKGAGSS